MFIEKCSLSLFIQVTILLIVFCFDATGCDETNDATPYVTTNTGKYKGSILQTVKGRNIYSFRGIRYGKPPVGKLRFMPPKPVDRSRNEFDSSEEGPACPQPGNLTISEDCLRLNVYTPSLHSSKKLPVIFYMHPGGFYGFSGLSYLVGPDYLLDHDVVLVSINYRLGSLGFISTGDVNSPGNNGYKDQVLAMKWVRDNIAAFGGDPNSVTLLGYSAGSLSITLHLVSPMSRGLFHRGIAMSASSVATWKYKNSQLDLAKRQAREVNCPTDNSKVIIECLRTKSAQEMGDSLLRMFEIGFNPILLWEPVIEPDCGQERFLPDDPVKLMERGKLYQVPFITGVTKYEFAEPAYAILQNFTMGETMINEQWNSVAPILFLYERNTTDSLKISSALKDFYFQESELEDDEKYIKGLRELFADSVIGYPVHRFVNLMAKYSKKPLYYYKFSYSGRFSYFYLPTDTGEQIPLGPVHHDDLLYLFYNTYFPKFNKTDDEFKMVERMTEMWSNFATHGCPTVPTSIVNIDWPHYNNLTKFYMNIDNEMSTESCLYCDRYNVWDNIYESL